MNHLQLQNPSLLQIENMDNLCWGANQEWYPTDWQQKAGCGPTACSHLLWYLARTRPGYSSLCPDNGNNKDAFLQLMEAVWPFVTPGNKGVNKTSMLADGGIAYAQTKDIALASTVLNIPPMPLHRPQPAVLNLFLQKTLGRNLPVAFLNLSNGALQNLDAWHWVTLIEANTQTLMGTMLDAEKKQEIDLGLWLQTSKLGGGFVALHPVAPSL